MHANELLKRIVTRLAHQTESERDLLLAAVDVAFPVAEPEPDEDQAPEDKTPPTAPVFSDPAPA